jgi:hypothetical protein
VFGRIELYPGAEVAISVIPPHADRVVVAAGQQGLARRRTQRRCMEAVVLQTTRREPLGSRGCAWAAERARRTEAGVVDHDDEHVRGLLRRPSIGGKDVAGSFAS